VGLGLAFGALVITHWQNALYALFAAAVLGGGLLRAPAARWIAMVRTGLAAAAAAGLVVLVQALAFYRQSRRRFWPPTRSSSLSAWVSP
jgi:hypothetical protein